MKIAAYGLFLLTVVLFATFYAVSRGALARTDAVTLTWGECLCVVPVGMALLLVGRKRLDRDALRRGALLGGCLCLMLFALAVALQDTSATETAFFPCLQGIFASLLSWGITRERVASWTWAAAGLAVIGMVLMIGAQAHAAAWRGDAGAVLGALLYTTYIFLVDALLVRQAGARSAVPPVLGVQFVVLGVGASVLMLLFGNWQHAHVQWPQDGFVLAYVAGIIVVSCIISALMQRYVDAVTVSFIYILEPLVGSLVAYLYLGERFAPQSYAGFGFVFLGVLVQTGACAVAERRHQAKQTEVKAHEAAPLVPWSVP
jgi:drug/metabolite transporter (DMT)-like permease